MRTKNIKKFEELFESINSDYVKSTKKINNHIGKII